MPETTRTIGAVVDELRASFPDLTISKVRYLEDRGLLTPTRSPRGTRRYGPDDVSRIAEILRLQREQYLPLDVVAGRLEGWSPRPADAPPPGPLTVEELAVASSLSGDSVEELTTHGVLRRDGDRFPSSSVPIARAAAVLLSEGLEPRHLRLLRSGTEQVSDTLRGTTRALRRGPDGETALRTTTDRAEAAVRDLLGAIVAEEFDRLRSE